MKVGRGLKQYVFIFLIPIHFSD
jgi:hypothetical protein